MSQLVKHGSSLYLVDAAEGFTLEQTDDMSGRERRIVPYDRYPEYLRHLRIFTHWSFITILSGISCSALF